jgi:hypothetical protein
MSTLHEFSKEEWFDVYCQIFPHGTWEEFEADWEEFQRHLKRRVLH